VQYDQMVHALALFPKYSFSESLASVFQSIAVASPVSANRPLLFYSQQTDKQMNITKNNTSNKREAKERAD